MRGDQHVSIVGHACVCAERLPCCLYIAAAAAGWYSGGPGTYLTVYEGLVEGCHNGSPARQQQTQAAVVKTPAVLALCAG